MGFCWGWCCGGDPPPPGSVCVKRYATAYDNDPATGDEDWSEVDDTAAVTLDAGEEAAILIASGFGSIGELPSGKTITRIRTRTRIVCEDNATGEVMNSFIEIETGGAHTSATRELWSGTWPDTETVVEHTWTTGGGIVSGDFFQVVITISGVENNGSNTRTARILEIELQVCYEP